MKGSMHSLSTKEKLVFDELASLFQGKRFLVTGGAGAIGHWLVRILLEHNEVVVVDNLASGNLLNYPKHDRLQIFREDIVFDECLNKAFETPYDVVFHLAASFANQNSVEHPRKDLMINGIGTLHILQKSQESKSGRVVYASSSCVYGNCSGAVSEDHSFDPGTPYAISKLAGEQYVQYFHEMYGLPTAILRYFNSFGPGEWPGKYRNVIPNFLDRARQNNPLPITGDGEETRDFNYVLNTVQGTLLAGLKPEASGQAFNIGSGRSVTIRHLAESVNRVTNNTSGIEWKPPRQWDHVRHRCADITKAKDLLGYTPKIDFELGLQQTWEWLKCLPND